MNEDTARGQELLPRLKVMNAINKDETSFDDQLLEFADQAQSDLKLSGLTYDNVNNKKAYDSAVMAYTNMFFNNDDKSNRDFLKAQYDQLTIDLIGEIRPL